MLKISSYILGALVVWGGGGGRSSPTRNFILSYFTISKSNFINYTIYSSIPTFYFPILLIKIIFLHNKIIYPTITIIYNTTHYLFFLSLSFVQEPQSPPLLNYTHLTPPPPPTQNLPSTPKKKKPRPSTPPKKNTATHDQTHTTAPTTQVVAPPDPCCCIH